MRCVFTNGTLQGPALHLPGSRCNTASADGISPTSRSWPFVNRAVLEGPACQSRRAGLRIAAEVDRINVVQFLLWSNLSGVLLNGNKNAVVQ